MKQIFSYQFSSKFPINSAGNCWKYCLELKLGNGSFIITNNDVGNNDAGKVNKKENTKTEPPSTFVGIKFFYTTL
jgi:hypothetical protein